MEPLLDWLNPLNWLTWLQENPFLALLIVVPLVALIIWRLIKGGVGTRRAVINVAGIGLILWGTLWFADWVQPSLMSEDLFTPPVVGPQAVKVVLAKQKTIERTATYTGTVHPYERVVLRARTEGFVKEVSGYPGDKVDKGQILVRLETSEIVPRLAKARAEHRFLRAELKRDERLFRGGAIPSSAIELSRSKERVAAATVSLLETEIGYAKVRTPSNGWISRRVVDPGQFVRKGQHLLAYVRIAKVRIRFDVAIQDLVNLKVGTKVILEFPEIPSARIANVSLAGRLVEGYRGTAIQAAVTSVFPTADEKSRLGVVEAMIDNPDLILKPNLYVIGHFVTGRSENAWVVPIRALTPMPGGKTVIFVAPAFSDQGEAEMREVKIGLRTGKEAQILEGIKEPVFVVISGNRSLTDGETVMVIARDGGL